LILSEVETSHAKERKNPSVGLGSRWLNKEVVFVFG